MLFIRLCVLASFLSGIASSHTPTQPTVSPVINVKLEQPASQVNWFERWLPGILQGAIGGGIAVFGVWLANRNNQALAKANREHELATIQSERKEAVRRKALEDVLNATHCFFQHLIDVSLGKTSNRSGAGVDLLDRLINIQLSATRTRLYITGEMDEAIRALEVACSKAVAAFDTEVDPKVVAALREQISIFVTVCRRYLEYEKASNV